MGIKIPKWRVLQPTRDVYVCLQIYIYTDALSPSQLRINYVFPTLILLYKLNVTNWAAEHFK